MHIGFDAKRAFLNNTGLGNYSRTLIQSLADFYPENQYFLYATKLPENNQTKLFFQDKFSLRCPPLLISKSLWRSRFVLSQLKKDSLDIYHGLSHELPFGLQKTNIRSVVTIHDLIFLRYPELYPFIDRKIYRAKIKYACNQADAIIAISEQTKRDIVQFIDINPKKISVIYQSCSESFRKRHTEEEIQKLKQKYQLPNRFLLSVGTIEERKNLLLIAKALLHLPVDTKVVVVGKKTNYFEEVNGFLQKEKLSDSMIFLPRIPFDELPVLYQAADIFIYPSRFEGFGIPVLEALCSGVPVIAAKGSCLEEAGGPGSAYINADDDEGLTNVVKKILNDTELSKKMIQSGRMYSEQFTTQNSASQLMKLYKEVIIT